MRTRRTLVKLSCVFAACAMCIWAAALNVKPVSAQSQEYPADRQTIEKWMDLWMATDRGALGALHVSRFSDPIYFLTKPITWRPNPGDQERFQSVTVPIGFVTDFASIPRLFWSLLPSDGRYTYPAIVHDFLYWTQTKPKNEADMILKFGMEDFGVGTAKSFAIYNAVHLFGSNAWNENANLKIRGEKRILKRFPDNPTTTWAEWKKLQDNFE
jgi:Protein of unknown function (DUF1353)